MTSADFLERLFAAAQEIHDKGLKQPQTAAGASGGPNQISSIHNQTSGGAKQKKTKTGLKAAAPSSLEAGASRSHSQVLRLQTTPAANIESNLEKSGIKRGDDDVKMCDTV